jgi:hypothetical protein
VVWIDAASGHDDMDELHLECGGFDYCVLADMGGASIGLPGLGFLSQVLASCKLECLPFFWVHLHPFSEICLRHKQSACPGNKRTHMIFPVFV